MTKAPNLGKQRQRVPDSMWLTNRCQVVIDKMNKGELSEAQAISELQVVGNTAQQALEIVERHRGLPPSGAREPKPRDPLRRVKR